MSVPARNLEVSFLAVVDRFFTLTTHLKRDFVAGDTYLELDNGRSGNVGVDL
jgi:hypothetical protein